MRLLGFTYHPKGPGGVGFFHSTPARPPGVLVVGGAPTPLAVAPPVVLIHGLGIGLAPYLRFIRRLGQARECFVVELPEVSQTGVQDTLSPDIMVEALAAMLATHGHGSACFVALCSSSMATASPSLLTTLRPLTYSVSLQSPSPISALKGSYWWH